MSAWGGGPFAGGGGSGSAAVGVALSTILMRAYRIAGISKWVGTTLQDDWMVEAVAEMNAMIGGLNCNRLNIFNQRTDAFPCNNYKAFLIGSGSTAQTIAGVSYGAFDMPRPQKITNGVIFLGNPTTSGVVSLPPMYQMNDEEWAQIQLQDVPNGIPLAFYYDGSYSVDNGWGVVYLWTQTTQSYYVQWYSWQAIPTFQTSADQVALPPGYEDMLVYCLAERLYNLNPHQCKMTAQAFAAARKARLAIQKLNAPQPKVFDNDASNVGNTNGMSSQSRWDYRFGGFR